MGSEDIDRLIARTQENVGRRIAELREQAGVTQAFVAGHAGISVNNLQRIEYGGQNLTIESLVKIAQALGTTPAALFEPVTVKRVARRGRPKKST